MEDLSLHTEDKENDLLSVEIIDNGIGMDKETRKKVLDPFYTSKTVRRFGLGLPLLSEAAKAANGQLSLESKKGEGTRVKADFQYSHIDRKPMGDMGQTIITLIVGNPEIDLIYVHKKNSHTYTLDTRKLKAQLKEAPLNSLDGIRMIRENLKGMREPSE